MTIRNITDSHIKLFRIKYNDNIDEKIIEILNEI